MSSSFDFDVAIVGGGPAGAATATFLKQYAPHLSVIVFEREQFPRDHVGESLLPAACKVLHRMGCWDKVEAAGFPIKIGATYRWGSTNNLWDFDFLAGQPFVEESRPATFEGQRAKTAFQVDRSIFDQILLDHAELVGAEVRQQTRVSKAWCHNEVIDYLELETGSKIKAQFYVDATGHSGFLRRALNIGVTEPSTLKNIAVWRYWNNVDWAVTLGNTGTRVQVLSLGWGWIWIIPITSSRTSIGLVVPADYYKSSGLTHEELYASALSLEPNVVTLLKQASAENEVFATKDWSFMADKIAGKNWLLVGESAGFADPILAAGITLTLAAAQEAAITICESLKGNHEDNWLREEYERTQKQRLRTHIQFADYWYTANGHFKDLIEYTGSLANQSGVPLRGQDAWQWLGTGGFVQLGAAGIAGFNLAGTSWLVNEFGDEAPNWQISMNNRFRLNLTGATPVNLAIYQDGFVEKVPGLRRADKVLPARGVYRFLVQVLTHSEKLETLIASVTTGNYSISEAIPLEARSVMEALEAMIADGWVTARCDPNAPLLDLSKLSELSYLRKNRDNDVVF